MIRGPDRDPAILVGHKHNIVQAVSTIACITAASGSHITLMGSCRCAPATMQTQSFSLIARVESAVSLSLRQQWLARLQDELPATEFSMGIRPLQAELSDNTLALYAPNRFVLDWVRDKYLNNINGLL